jgi:cell division protease FtsH
MRTGTVVEVTAAERDRLEAIVAEPTTLSIGGSGGLAESDIGEMQADTRAHLENFLVVILGGRAAEELTFGEVTAGAGGAEHSDLARATRLATRLETALDLAASAWYVLPTTSAIAIS